MRVEQILKQSVTFALCSFREVFRDIISTLWKEKYIIYSIFVGTNLRSILSKVNWFTQKKKEQKTSRKKWN